MKLTNYPNTGGASRKAPPPSKGKRKREQLLLKPPPSPELRSANDVAGDREEAAADAADPRDKSRKCRRADELASPKRNEQVIRRQEEHRRQSAENSRARHHNDGNPSPSSERDGTMGRVARAGPTSKSTSEMPNDQFGSKRTRQRFQEIRHYFDLNRARRGSAEAATPARGLMTLAKDHQRGSERAAEKISRRKSELTSFLTILFGSMLAVLLLTSSQILCRQNGAGQFAASGRATTNLHNATGSRSAPNIIAANESRVTIAPEAAESETATATANDDNLPSTGAPASASKDFEDYEEAADSDRTKLADSLADAARDGTDLLIDHLQRGRDSANSGDEPEEPDENNQLEPEASGKAAEGSNSTDAAAGPTANALAAGHEGGGGKLVLNETEQTRFALETYAKWRAAGDDIIELFSRKLMPIIIEHGYDVDSGTVAGLLQAFNGIRQLKPWALKLLDAWTKISPGVLLGTQADFGDFDECLNIRVDDPNGLAAANSEHFPGDERDPLTGLRTTTLVGRYCLADVEFPKPPRRRAAADRQTNSSTSPTWPFEPIELRRPLLDFAQLPAYKDTIFVETGNFFHMLYVDPIRVGICLTNKIDPASFQQVFNKLFEEFRVSINFRGRCVTKYDRPVWTAYQKVSAYVLVVACALIALSTGLDLILAKFGKFPCPRSWAPGRMRVQMAAQEHRDLITSFSLIRNTKRLFKPSADTRPAQTGGLHHQSHHREQQAAAAPSCAGSSSAATTSSSLADSSVESSPSIERRSSAETTTSSMRDLIGGSLDKCQQHLKDSHRQAAARQACCCDESKSSASSALAREQQAAFGPRVSLLSLHGIRVITMVWMIVNHTYMFGGFFVLWAHRRLIDIAEWPKSLSFQMVLNGWLTVETYFFLSAMIIVLNVLPLMRARKFNYFHYILHRLLRLLPAYVGLVSLNFLWPLVSSGPVWLVKGKSFVQDPCEQYLWTNFLFINNWIWPEKQCMVHTWFLSADFQLYLLAPVIVYLLYRRPALGHLTNLAVAVLAAILSGFVIYANKLLPTTLINKLEFDAIKQQLSYSYFATYQHMGPYCLGLLVGYLLHKRPHARLPKHLTWLLWLLLPPLSFTTLLLTYLWNGAYSEANLVNPSPLVSALYVAIHRTIWTALVAWIVFACATGRAKLLASFLSNAIFLPISRLSYSIYLVHLPVIMFRSLNLRHTVEWTDQNILWEACGNFVVSSLLGFFLNVAFESPIINLENVIFKRHRGSNDGGAISPLNSKQSSQMVGNILVADKGKMALSTGHPDKQTNSVPLGSSHYATSTNSSDGCEDSMTNELATQTMRSLRQKHSDSTARKSARATQTANIQVRETDSDHRSLGRRRQHKQQLASAMLEDRRADHDEQTSEGAQTDESLSMHQDQSAVLQTASASRRALANNGEELYDVAGEYRHYAPANYQQWRRAMGQFDAHHHQPVASSTSMRAMQYATLARTNRAAREPALEAQDQPTHRRHFENQAYGQQFLEALNQGEHALPDHLTQNSSEMNFHNGFEGGRTTLMHQRQMLASRRRQGRYNTLTGTGSRDWRSQVQARNHHLQNQLTEADLLRRWEQEPAAVWPSGVGAHLIPRVDWNTTLRRQQRNSNAAPSAQGSGSLPPARQEQPDDGKILEELSAEAEETSAL